MPEVRVYYGPTGTGKTHSAMMWLPDAYSWGPSIRTWFQDYDGEEEVILNEFRGQLPFSQLLELLDKWPTKVAKKGGSCDFRGLKIAITSPRRLLRDTEVPDIEDTNGGLLEPRMREARRRPAGRHALRARFDQLCIGCVQRTIRVETHTLYVTLSATVTLSALFPYEPGSADRRSLLRRGLRKGEVEGERGGGGEGEKWGEGKGGRGGGGERWGEEGGEGEGEGGSRVPRESSNKISSQLMLVGNKRARAIATVGMLSARHGSLPIPVSFKNFGCGLTLDETRNPGVCVCVFLLYWLNPSVQLLWRTKFARRTIGAKVARDYKI
ncbi:hypothetical protein T492DRAFT_848246 [Pavlovales sp. CCMP2436]|nr:hypothetical protein T492DRAFT_848246 [Pavlovales sp. CCMP2436]